MNFFKIIHQKLRKQGQFNANSYWENRYRKGGNSGAGSYGKLAEYKAEFLNSFVKKQNISSVIEFGCGDGNQLSLAIYPKYLGIDASRQAIEICQEKFSSDTSKKFLHSNEYRQQKMSLSLSLDVIFHIIDDKDFEIYMNRLFASGERFVIIYSSNRDDDLGAESSSHVRHRVFTDWIKNSNISTEWKLIEHYPNQFPFDATRPNNTSFSEFFVYKKI